MNFCRLPIYIKIIFFSEKNLSGIQSDCQTFFDRDQARHLVGPDLGPNCLQSLSADDTCRQRVNIQEDEFIFSVR